MELPPPPAHPQVAIDGPVASGKTTVAHLLAHRLGFLYLDTGAMYRALALAALRAGVDVESEHALLDLLRAKPIRVTLDVDAPLGYRISAGGAELGPELFSPEVSAVVSAVAAHRLVRAEMVAQQRRIAAEGPVVMAGRDIGTVVLPAAQHKIFLTASVAARVVRRHAELAAAGIAADRGALRAQIEERDRLDATRPVAPLRPAADAWIVDSTDLSAEQVVERIAACMAADAPAARR
jgi:cytidylate kinase